MPVKKMRKVTAQLTAAASEMLQNSNARKPKAAGMIVAHLAQEQGRNTASRFVNHSANAGALLGLNARAATNAG